MDYFNSENSLWYEQQGDYYIPCLTLGEEDKRPIRKWGRKHLRYIKEYRPVLYTVLFLGGKLSGHLAENDTRADWICSPTIIVMVRDSTW